MAGDIEVLPSATTAATVLAEHVVRAARAAISATGRFVIALSGGSAPRESYALLATAPYASRVEWPRVHVLWGDERCVPPDHAESNYGMARELLLRHVPIPEAQVHRIHGEEEPQTAAEAYEGTLRSLFDTPDGPPRTDPRSRIDLALQGLGEDGHTASLFPGAVDVHRSERWVEHTRGKDVWRVTLTPRLLNASGELVFLVLSASKRSVLQRVLHGPFEPHALPAQLIIPVSARLTWIVDAPAAGE